MPSQFNQSDDSNVFYTDAYDIRIVQQTPNNKRDICGNGSAIVGGGSGIGGNSNIEKYHTNGDLMRENYVNKSNQSLCGCSNVEPLNTFNDTHNLSFDPNLPEEYIEKCPKSCLRQNSSYIDIASIPPPPPIPLSRKPSIRSQISSPKNYTNPSNPHCNNTLSLLDCINNRMQKFNSQFKSNDIIQKQQQQQQQQQLAILNNQTKKHNQEIHRSNSIDIDRQQQQKQSQSHQINSKIMPTNWMNCTKTTAPTTTTTTNVTSTPSSKTNCSKVATYNDQIEFDFEFNDTTTKDAHANNDPPPYYDADHPPFYNHIINNGGKYNTIGSSKHYHNACELSKFHALASTPSASASVKFSNSHINSGSIQNIHSNNNNNSSNMVINNNNNNNSISCDNISLNKSQHHFHHQPHHHHHHHHNQHNQHHHHQHHKSSTNSLLNGRYFTNSLTNFHCPSLPNRHFTADASSIASCSAAYTQFHNANDQDIAMLDDAYHLNDATLLSGSSASVVAAAAAAGTATTAGATLKQQQQFGQHIPWRHRHCPSVGSNSSGTSFTKWDASRHWLAVTMIVLIAGAASVAVPLALRVSAEAPYEERLHAATQLLTTVPLIDGHNDLPWNIRKFVHNQLNDFQFDMDLKTVPPWSKSQWSHTDLIRLKKGQVSAQFWAAYVPCESQYRDAVQLTLEQIDVIIRLTEKYSPQLTTCTSAIDILEAFKNHQLCSLTGVEGGHSLGGSLSVLRTFYALGVRYMTLTSTCHTPWADSSYADAPRYEVKHGGLTEFGKTIIREMNRLGMIVDLSHVSIGTMRDALAVSEAPVIFSHSSAFELCNSSRNVQDSILHLLAKNRGLVMINFYSKFLSCSENATVRNAVDHLNHIKLLVGIDHVGLGAGFDGINFTPKGLEDVSTYPTLFAELLGYGWTMDELTKLAGQNFLRVLEEVEMVRDRKRDEGMKPYEEILNFRLDDIYNCTSS